MRTGHAMTSHTGSRETFRAGWWIALIAFLSGIGGGVVFPILPMLGVELGIPAAMVGLILAANRITRIFFNPFTGSLVDRFGARWPVSIGLFLETLAVLGFSLALHTHQPALWFIAGRVVWGVGSSLILVGALAAVMLLSGRANRGRLTGRVRTAMTLGMPAGMLVGGLVSDLASPNTAFLAAAALTLATGFLATRILPRGTGAHAPEPQPPAGSRWRAWRELLRHPVLQVIWSANALVFFALAGVLLSTLVVLVDARGVHVAGLGSEGSAGLLMAWLMIFRAIAALGSGSVLDRSGSRTRWLLPAAFLSALGFAGLALALSVWQIALALAAIGLGSGALTIPLLTLMSDTASRPMQGRAMSVYQVYGDIGGSVGPIIGLQLGVLVGYGPIYIGVACAMILITVPLWRLVRRERSQAR
jgi:MFS family permease